MQAHGQPHQAQLSHPLLAPEPVLLLHTQNLRIAPHQADQASRPRQRLGQHGGQSRAEYIQPQGENKDHVQHNIHQGGRDQPDHRRAAVPQGTENTGAVVVEHVGGQADENGLDIGVGTLVNIRRRIHHGKNPVAHHGRGDSHDQTDQRRQPHAAGDVPAQLMVVSRAELPGHRDGKPAAHAAAEAHHQEIDGPGGAHRRQGRASKGLAHNGGIHHIV